MVAKIFANPDELFQTHPAPNSHYWPKVSAYQTEPEDGMVWLSVRPEKSGEEGVNGWAMPVSAHASIGIIQVVQMNNNGVYVDTDKFLLVTKPGGNALVGGCHSFNKTQNRMETDQEAFVREALEEAGATVVCARHWITFQSPMPDRINHDCSVWIAKATVDPSKISLDESEKANNMKVIVCQSADEFINQLQFNVDYFMQVVSIYMNRTSASEADNKWRNIFKSMIRMTNFI